MEREILTNILNKEQLYVELKFIVEYFIENNIHYCDIVFGFAWGMEYYPTEEWNNEKIYFRELIKKVHEIEKTNIGSLGRDDLFIKLPNLEFRFCNDSDIHIYFDEENNKDIEFFYSRWKNLNYEPSEWIKNQKNAPGERVRFN